jgi:hypothetical protein
MGCINSIPYTDNKCIYPVCSSNRVSFIRAGDCEWSTNSRKMYFKCQNGHHYYTSSHDMSIFEIIKYKS